MSSTFSVINDLYGVEAARRPVRQGGFGLALLMLLGATFLYESVHPVMRFRTGLPSSNPTAAATDNQGSVAQSYWNLAADFVSEKYSYGEFLPNRPPEEFTTAMGGDYATSSLYWQKVRGIWNQPGSWVRLYQLDTEWIYRAVGSMCKMARNYFNR